MINILMANTLKPDTALKSYWRRNDEFADLFNAFLYNGRPVIKPSSLLERDSDDSVILRLEDHDDSRSASRDLFKVVMASGHTQYALLGLENQNNVHYAMPLRDLQYNLYSYLQQYERIKSKYPGKKGLSGDAFLSHMNKSDKLTPIVTLVLYYGEKPWDAAKSLHQMMALPEELRPFVSDHHMNLIELRNSKLHFHNKNNIDLFHLLQLMYNRSISNRKQLAIDYADENLVDRSVLLAIGGIHKVKFNFLEKEGLSMCTLFEEIKKEGELIGETRGELIGRAKEIISLGREFGLDDEAIILKLQERLNIDMAKSREYFEQFN